MKRERERENLRVYVKKGICVKCILCNETPQFCSLKKCYLELANKNVSFSPSLVELAVLSLHRGLSSISQKNTPALYFFQI